MNARNAPMPRKPVFGWASLSGARLSPLPSLLDRDHMVMTSSGRAAILLALESFGVGPGDTVLVPSYHCPTMISPVVTLGATPVFYPLNPQGAPDIAQITTGHAQGARAMIAAHFFGLPLVLDDVAAWCHARGIKLIEDCAHALCGSTGHRAVGALGDMAIGSLTKFLPVPDGGCLVANAAGLLPVLTAPSLKANLKAGLDIVEMGALHQRLGWAGSLLNALLALARGRPTDFGGAAASDDTAVASVAKPTRLDPTVAHQAVTRASGLLARRLPRERIVRLRRDNYTRLATLLDGHAGLRPLQSELPFGAAPYVFPLWVDNPDPGYQALRRAGVPVYRWNVRWSGAPDVPTDVGAQWSHHVLQLGCHQDLTRAEVDAIAAVALRTFEQAHT
jgi:dTDP-4-amino-4,6-dideoxygalactose transaminase